jgi:PKD repeat protein
MHTKNKLKKIFAGVTLLLMLQMTFSSLAFADFGDVVNGDQGFGDWAGNAVEDIGSWLTSGGSDTTTSFTDFKGGLQAPSKEGYAGSLTQASDARTFVLNVTNFILGFLGLTAVIVIIYGGFVYVTAAGDEGKTEKGKKSVSYAIIGILMILASFAIVNTVLQAPSGTDSPNKGSAEEQSNTSGTVQRRFNVLASRVQEMAKNLLVAFKFHIDVVKDIAEIKDLMKKANEHIANCEQNGCGDNWGDGLYDNLVVWRQNADNALAKLQHIKTVAPSQLFNSIAIRSVVDDATAYINTYWADALNRASAKADENGCDDNVLKPCDGDESGGPENRAVFSAFKSVAFENKYLDNVETIVLGNFGATVNNAKMDLKSMYQQVAVITDVATEAFTKLASIDFLRETSLGNNPAESDTGAGTLNSLKDAVKKIDKDTVLENDKTPMLELRTAITDLGALYTILKDILFVDAKITASSVSGNAPLIVNFSSVGSLDPSGITITENQIAWDLDGDGVFGEEVIDGAADPVMNCNEGKIKDTDLTKTDTLITATSPVATSCVYKKPGTYRAKLKIKSAHDLNPVTGKTYDKEIGVGLATIDINVLPAQTRINLSIDNAPGGAVNVMKYKDDGSGLIEEDRQAVVFPLSIAKSSGVQFNAATTKDKDNQFLAAQAGDGATALWDFDNNANDGVNKVLLPASELKPAAAKYDKAGDYNVSLELTDKNKVLDRKLFALKVSALVPVLQLSKPSANVGDEVTFDGSNSVSDNGQISSYTWQITPALPGVDPAELKKDTFKYKFTEPGKYTVKLTVDDGIEPAPVSISEELNVTSKPPVAQFTYEIPDQHKPSTVVFNGTKSYDPDATDPSKVLKYRWEVNGKALTDGATGSESNYSYDNKDPNYPKITFAQKGDYTVTLVAIDTIGGSTQESLAFEKTVNISSVIDVAWKNAPSDKTTIILAKDATTQEQKATASMTLESKNGVSYDVDYGDGETEQGDFSTTKVLTHEYKATGTYLVKASVFDKDDEENFVTRKIYVGADNQPIAAISVKINGEDIIPDAVDPLIINRKDVLTLSGAESKNVDGTGRRLVYSWNLGDSELSAKESVTKAYKNLGDYEVKLTAKNANDLSMPAGNDTLKISVIGEKPTLKTITAVPTGTSLTTPVTVATTAVGAEDMDGKVIRYRWWYFSPSAPDDQLGVQVTTTPTANITIGTRGEEGAQVAYYFGVELTDDENNTISSGDVIDPKTTELSVTNGPNKAPVAKFNVDRTNVFVGESAEFTSSSSDPDGTIKVYYWDWEGDGFANNNKDEGPNVTHVFDKASKDGIKVRLQVIDSNESPAISDPVVIYVDSKAQPPVAAFTSTQEGTTKKMTLKNNSTVDKDNAVSLASAVWDFDVNVDSNGDGKKDNDEDAKVTDQVSYEYPDYGIYRAKLTVTDSNKQTSQVTNFVNVKAAAAPPAPTPTPKPAAPTPAPTPTPATPPATPSTQLDARLLTIPETSFTDGKIHLKGESATVTLDYSTSTGKIKSYIIDKNVFYDTNGNNVKEDDEDYKSTSAGKWTTEFFKSYGQTKVRLTVVGEDGKKDFVEKEIVFDKDVTPAKTGKVSVFDTETDTAVILLVCAAGFGILSLNLYRSKNKKPNA